MGVWGTGGAACWRFEQEAKGCLRRGAGNMWRRARDRKPSHYSKTVLMEPIF